MAATALGATVGAFNGFDARAAPPAITRDEPAYSSLVRRGYNRRFIAQPDRIHTPSSTAELLEAVQRSVRDDLRIAVRSGGHGFDDFVDGADTKALIDLQRLNTVDWDPELRAFSIGAGTDLDTVYRELARWGVTVPGGLCLGVGVGGHISGGGFGPLSRQFGLVADHLYGVEVITVDATGKATLALATRDGPNRDLWWAHTGGGGGNFGIVTRFLLRSPASDGTDPTLALPRVPETVLIGQLDLPMPMVTEDSFLRLLRNYLDFHDQHRDPGDPFTNVFARLAVRPLIESFTDLLVFSYGEPAETQSRLDEFLTAVSAGVTPSPIVLPPVRLGYLDSIGSYYAPPPPIPGRIKIKAALLRQPYTDSQLRVLYRALTDPALKRETFLEFSPLGGAINAVAPDATAMPARDTMMKMLLHAAWNDPADDDRFISWVRKTYAEVYAETSSVPVPGQRDGGSYINYPDPDLADPLWNTSATPWHELYYAGNYPRLQRVKSVWDPKNNFRHQLSVQPG
ncbi:FAD-binding oxidoreductase [Nocardia yamanashiensis]|uniref:FAD-binding oxidoreductase n=1 Tax=Nocardia yamanashiensis TaxID=209247 RepID=UPI001F247F27|nr:FAD-binding protein [Nocardia yamanashiensis]